MKDLVGRKIKCKNPSVFFTENKVYNIINHKENVICIIDDDDIKNFINIDILNDDFELIVDEWQPKQGEKVLVSDDNSEWEALFVCTYNGYYLVEHNGGILSTKYIKPYEEEIKVGDWVINTHVKSVFKNDTLNLGINNPKKFKKITDQYLISKLNEL